MIESARAHYRRSAVSIQRKEPDTGNSVVVNVGTHVELMKSAEAGHRGKIRRESPDVPHRERNDSDPRAAIEGVDRETFRNQRAQLAFLNTPMHEEQLAPTLMHERLALRPLANCHSIKLGKMS